MKTGHISKAWSLLDANERRNAIKVLVIMIVGAFSSAAMVASVFPFLTVLASPSLIRENAVLRWLYQTGGFTSDFGLIVALGFGAIGIIVASNLVLIFQAWAVIRFSNMLIHKLGGSLMAHYLTQPYEFFLGHHSGDMSTNILSEAKEVVDRYLYPLANLVSSALTVLTVVVTLILVDPVAATVSMGVFAIVYGGVSVITRRVVHRMGQQRAEANAERFRIVGEALGGIKDVKLLGREAAYHDRFNRPSLSVAEAEVVVAVVSQAPRYAIQIVAFGGLIVLCLALLDRQELQSGTALGGILPLIGLLAFAGQRLMPELQKLYQSVTTMTSGAAALDKVHAALTSEHKAGLDRSNPAPLGLKSELNLKDVTYSYPSSERAGLSGVNLTIKAGERIGIVGTSGAGKTTLADVVLGLLTPQAGQVWADDIEITPATLGAWQKTVGYVPQDIFLTDASLSENIAFGLSHDGINPVKVERAARIAQLHDFALAELPDGYESVIGERGVRLSGGQRQRIGIARALYHDADLIVFDEATSALDNLTERDVMTAIEALPGDKTVLMIAHRLSTVKICDRILVMDQGRVVGLGAWDDLLMENDAFRALESAGAEWGSNDFKHPRNSN